MNRCSKFFLYMSGCLYWLLNIGWMYTFIRNNDALYYKHIYRQPFDYAPLVSVEIAGEHYNFLLDSGSSVTVLDRRLARQIAVPLDAGRLSEKRVYRNFSDVQGTQGLVDAARIDFVRPIDMKLGPFLLRGQDVWITTDLSALSESIGVQISGLLGVDTFRQFSWDIVKETKVMEISKYPLEASSFDECVGYSDQYGSQPGVMLGFGNQKVFMPIDTGATRSYVSKELIDHLRAESSALETRPGKEVVVTADGIGEVARHVINDVTFDGEALGALEVHETPENFGAGLDLLARFSRYAFIPSKMMFCYSGPKRISQLPTMYRDVKIKVEDGRMQLDYNWSEQLKGLNLMNGDIVERVNGRIYPPNQIHVVRDLLRNTPSGMLSLQVLRNQRVLQIRL